MEETGSQDMKRMERPTTMLAVMMLTKMDAMATLLENMLDITSLETRVQTPKRGPHSQERRFALSVTTIQVKLYLIAQDKVSCELSNLR